MAAAHLVVRSRADCGCPSSYGSPGRQGALLWSQGLTKGMRMAVEAGDMIQGGGVQVHGWREGAGRESGLV